MASQSSLQLPNVIVSRPVTALVTTLPERPARVTPVSPAVSRAVISDGLGRDSHRLCHAGSGQPATPVITFGFRRWSPQPGSGTGGHGAGNEPCVSGVRS